MPDKIIIRKMGDYRYFIYRDKLKVGVAHFIRCNQHGYEMTVQKKNGNQSIVKVEFISEGKKKLANMRY